MDRLLRSQHNFTGKCRLTPRKPGSSLAVSKRCEKSRLVYNQIVSNCKPHKGGYGNLLRKNLESEYFLREKGEDPCLSASSRRMREREKRTPLSGAYNSTVKNCKVFFFIVAISSSYVYRPLYNHLPEVISLLINHFSLNFLHLLLRHRLLPLAPRLADDSVHKIPASPPPH